MMFGFIQFAAGIAGLVQYPLFKWYEAYEGSYLHVSIKDIRSSYITFLTK